MVNNDKHHHGVTPWWSDNDIVEMLIRTALITGVVFLIIASAIDPELVDDFRADPPDHRHIGRYRDIRKDYRMPINNHSLKSVRVLTTLDREDCLT